MIGEQSLTAPIKENVLQIGKNIVKIASISELAASDGQRSGQ